MSCDGSGWIPRLSIVLTSSGAKASYSSARECTGCLECCDYEEREDDGDLSG